jgi:hypothetical protein
VSRELLLRKRIRWLTCFFILGLVLSGATAIPLRSELDWLVQLTRAQEIAAADGI